MKTHSISKSSKKLMAILCAVMMLASACLCPRLGGGSNLFAGLRRLRRLGLDKCQQLFERHLW